MAKNSQYHFYVLFIIRRGYTGSLQFLWSFLLKQFGKWCIEARNICRSLISFNLFCRYRSLQGIVFQTDSARFAKHLNRDLVMENSLLFLLLLTLFYLKRYFLQDVLQLIEGVHVIHQHPCLPPIPPEIHLLLLFHLISRPHSKRIDGSSCHGDMELGESERYSCSGLKSGGLLRIFTK